MRKPLVPAAQMVEQAGITLYTVTIGQEDNDPSVTGNY